MLETEAGHASTLLEPFAHMPEFQGDAREAAARLALLDGSLAPVGGRLELAALGGDQGAEPWVVLARRSLALRDANLELRHRTDPDRLDRFTRRAILISIPFIAWWRWPRSSWPRSGSCDGICWRRYGPSRIRSA